MSFWMVTCQRLKRVGKESKSDTHEFGADQQQSKVKVQEFSEGSTTDISPPKHFSTSPTRQPLDGSIKRIPRRDRVCRRRLPVPGRARVGRGDKRGGGEEEMRGTGAEL